MKVMKELDRSYKGKYVLLKGDMVLAIVDSLNEAYEVLRDKGLEKCIIYRADEIFEKGEWGWSSIDP